MRGKVYLIGAGPGSPDLITVRGRRILQQAEVIIYDYLVDKRMLEEAKEGATLICCEELGKKRYSCRLPASQDKINNLMVKEAKRGRKVARLKCGDPGIFGRTSSELDALTKNKIRFEIVPGVTAASAASCFSGIPLTDRNLASSICIVTGHEKPQKKESSLDWNSIGKAGTIVLYMAVENLAGISAKLVAVGKPKETPAAIVKDAGLLTQRMLLGNLATIAKKAKSEKITPPAIIIIGKVVSLEKKFNWLKKARRVLFTGISPERFFSHELVFHLTLIRLVPLEDYGKQDALLKDISGYDWLIFTSRYGVEYFFSRLYKIGCDSRVLKGLKIAAIGESTKKRLLDFGVLADLVPKDESSYGLVNAFKKEDIKDKKIFLTRSDLSDKGFQASLKAQGAKVTPCILYKNIAVGSLPDLDLHFFHEIMFTSPSTVRSFKQRYKKIPPGVKIRCIGRVTKDEAVRQGFLLHLRGVATPRRCGRRP